jgi:hypothetical protein
MRYPSPVQVASGVAVGAVDLAMHKIDQQQNLSKPFENATDLFRTGVTLGGMFYYGMKGAALGFILFDNGLPLLTESVAYAVGKYAKIKIPGAPTADPAPVQASASVPRPVSSARVTVSAPSSNFIG